MSQPYQWLGSIEVHIAVNRLQLGNAKVQVEPRAMQLLDLLLARRGEVVSRREIFEQVWGHSHIAEDSLNRIIFDLRKACKSLDPQATPIETIRKVGYRISADEEVQLRSVASRLTSHPLLLLLSVAIVAIATLSLWRPWNKTQNPAGVRSVAVTVFSNSADLETHPDIHPDGQLVVFSCSKSDLPIGLCSQRLDNQRQAKLRVNGGEGAAVHPDGIRLAYQRIAEGQCEIRVFHLDSADDRRLGSCRHRNDGSLAWSPDGRNLFYSDRMGTQSGAAGPFQIQSIPATGGAPSSVSRPPINSVGDLYPTPSGDGRWLAFFRADLESTTSTYITPGIGRVFRVAMLANQRDRSVAPQALTEQPAEITGLAYLATDLYLFTNAHGQFELWRIDQNLRRSAFGPFSGIYRQPAAVPGQHMIIAEAWSADADLRVLSIADPDSETALFSSTRFDLSPAVSPDGRYLSWISSRGGSPRVWLGDLAREAIIGEVELSSGQTAESPKWSPSGEQIAFEARADGRSEVVLYDLGSAQISKLDLPGDNRVPSWSLDGRSLLHASDRSGAWEVWRYDLKTAATERLTKAGGYAQQEYRINGDHGLIFSRRDQAGLWRQSYDQDRVTQIMSELPIEYWGNWWVHDQQVYAAVNRSPEGPAIITIDLQSGKQSTLVRLQQPLLRESTNLSVSPDGLTLYYAIRSRISADLVRIGPLP